MARRRSPMRITVGGAVAGDVGTRSVDDVGQRHGGEELGDELGAELALHEGVRGDLADVAGAAAVVAAAGEAEEALCEGHGELELPVARRVPLPVGRADVRVLDRDIRRVADHDVIRARVEQVLLAELVHVFERSLDADLLVDPGNRFRAFDRGQ